MIKISPLIDMSLIGPATVGDLKKFIETCKKLGIPDSADLIDCVLTIEMTAVDVNLILCGEHLVDDERYDILLEMHECKNNGGDINVSI